MLLFERGFRHRLGLIVSGSKSILGWERSPSRPRQAKSSEVRSIERFSLKVGYQTHPGMVRAYNEDSLLVDEELGLFVVADGLGGHRGGKLASSIAVEEIGRFIRAGLNRNEDLIGLIRASVLAAHRAIHERASQDPHLTDMGTTVVAALYNEDRVVVAHAGDSRAYLVMDGSIRQLTQDHTYVADWLEEGRITPEQARLHKAKHGLKIAVGVANFVGPEARHWPIIEDSCLLLCSDGLHDMLEDSEVLEVIESSKSPQEACTRLIGNANWRGGEDNVTVILICR